MTEQSHDKDFTAFLAGESDLADRYAELGREEPPPEIDAQILAEARAAAKVHRVEFGPRGGWFKPVALAATILLSFSLVMNVVVESPTRFEQVVSESARTGVWFENELPAKELRVFETPQSVSAQPTATMAAEKDNVLEELTMAGGDSIARIDIETDDKADVAADVELARSVETLSVTVRRIDRDADLLIVTEYVAAADKSIASGLVAAPRIESELEQNFRRKAERSRPATADSVTAGSSAAFSNEYKPDDVPYPEDSPEALLRDIERLRASGDSVAAVTRLDEFLARYPDHPVSLRIRQQDE